MSMIQIAARDLVIADAEYTDKDTGENVKKEVVRFKAACAFDEDFIEECKMAGVRKFEDKKNES